MMTGVVPQTPAAVEHHVVSTGRSESPGSAAVESHTTCQPLKEARKAVEVRTQNRKSYVNVNALRNTLDAVNAELAEIEDDPEEEAPRGQEDSTKDASAPGKDGGTNKLATKRPQQHGGATSSTSPGASVDEHVHLVESAAQTARGASSVARSVRIKDPETGKELDPRTPPPHPGSKAVLLLNADVEKSDSGTPIRIKSALASPASRKSTPNRNVSFQSRVSVVQVESMKSYATMGPRRVEYNSGICCSGSSLIHTPPRSIPDHTGKVVRLNIGLREMDVLQPPKALRHKGVPKDTWATIVGGLRTLQQKHFPGQVSQILLL
ncbi:unnamed protein product [Amoebophrya sp. A25]|nr:unnamed protein product [Amoebophrya sp. A25]|eukprot:GSA25T00021486001.1